MDQPNRLRTTISAPIITTRPTTIHSAKPRHTRAARPSGGLNASASAASCSRPPTTCSVWGATMSAADGGADLLQRFGGGGALLAPLLPVGGDAAFGLGQVGLGRFGYRHADL